MPKISKDDGPTYAGLVDTSPEHKAEPDWAEPVDEPAEAEPLVAETRRRRTRTRGDSTGKRSA